MLRHANSKTTRDLYAKSATPAKREAQGWYLKCVLEQEELALEMVQ